MTTENQKYSTGCRRHHRPIRQKSRVATNTVRSATAAPAKGIVPQHELFIGICTRVLRDLLSVRGEFVDAVYIDPPFCSSRGYYATPRGAKRKLQQWQKKVAFTDAWKWTDAEKKHFRELLEKVAPGTPVAKFLVYIRDELENNNGPLLAYLTHMTSSVVAIRDVMKPTALIALHCDTTASHYLQHLLRAVFGVNNFRNEIVRQCATAKNNTVNCIGSVTDRILICAKSRKARIRQVYIPYTEEYIRKNFRYTDAKGRKYASNDLLAPDNGKSTDLQFEFKGYTPPPGRCWSHTLERLVEMDKNGEIHQTSPSHKPGRIRYLDESKGVPVSDLWHTKMKLGNERNGYPTQKPLDVAEQIIKLISDQGDVVLDSFLGSGTTMEACNNLGRSCIGIDIGRTATQVTVRRMKTQNPNVQLVVGEGTPTKASGWDRLLSENDLDSPKWSEFQYDAIAAIPKAEQVDGEISTDGANARRGRAH